MNILFIGGTGNISSACSRLCLEKGYNLFLINRGERECDLEGAKQIVCDAKDEAALSEAIQGLSFDVVANFIAFTREDVARDIRVFSECAKQYVFISSASAYQKPLENPIVTESTPLRNPFWQYSRDKIACELELMEAHRSQGFPVTIVRPSLTYDTVWPVAIGSWDDFTLIDRMRRGKKVIIHGDGTSLWTVTHAEDFAKGFIGLLGNSRAIGESFHITSDELLTWNQIYQTVADVAGAELNAVHIPSDFIAKLVDWQEGNLLGDKAVSAVFDNSKIKRFVPGFEAAISFREGARRTLAWFEEKPERMKIVDYNNEMMDAIIEKYEVAFNAL